MLIDIAMLILIFAAFAGALAYTHFCNRVIDRPHVDRPHGAIEP